MDRERVAELRALCEAATGRGWYLMGTVGKDVPAVYANIGIISRLIASPPTNEDAAFIAAARDAVTELLDEVERLDRYLLDHCEKCDGGYWADCADEVAAVEVDAMRKQLKERTDTAARFMEEAERLKAAAHGMAREIAAARQGDWTAADVLQDYRGTRTE